MTVSPETEQDPVLNAIMGLSDIATASANDLAALQSELEDMKRHRVQGLTCRHLLSSADSPNVLSTLGAIATNLGRASGSFRRALALGLRREGMQVTEVANLFGVSRQRVSALIRPRDDAGDSDDGD
jgi:predicted XRE-type DNA-binding protein